MFVVIFGKIEIDKILFINKKQDSDIYNIIDFGNYKKTAGIRLAGIFLGVFPQR